MALRKNQPRIKWFRNSTTEIEARLPTMEHAPLRIDVNKLTEAAKLEAIVYGLKQAGSDHAALGAGATWAEKYARMNVFFTRLSDGGEWTDRSRKGPKTDNELEFYIQVLARVWPKLTPEKLRKFAEAKTAKQRFKHLVESTAMAEAAEQLRIEQADGAEGNVEDMETELLMMEDETGGQDEVESDGSLGN